MPSLNRPVKELLTPEPDGAVTDFTTAQRFHPGTVSIWVNGLRRLAAWDDGFTEIDDQTIRLKEAPLTGDSVQAEYQPE